MQVNDFFYNNAQLIDITSDENDLYVESNYIQAALTGDFSITGIENPSGGTIDARFVIENENDFILTLVSKSPDSLSENRFQMERDIQLRKGERASFDFNEKGLYLLKIYPSDDKFYYSVKDANIADVNSAEKVIFDSVPVIGALNYKVLEYNEAHVFNGSETWFIEMTPREVADNIWNPVFFDLSGVDAYEIGADLIESARVNQQLVKDIIIETAAGHLFKNGMTWTASEKLAFNLYWNKIIFYSGLGNVGAMMYELNIDLATIITPAIVTVADPFTGVVHNVDVLTSDMINHALGLCVNYKKKFPDGTV